MQNSSKKGFTLIEMALVLLVIGILAGIVLRNIGGQSSAARDTKRISDLKIVANYLAVYLGKYGYFPTSSNWDELEITLRSVGIAEKLPQDPSGKLYEYYYCSDIATGDLSLPEKFSPSDINHFILRAQLEQTSSTAPRLYENTAATLPMGWNCYIWPIDCSPEKRYYCLAQ